MSVAILSLVIVLPLAAAIVWQRHSRALWGSLFFGFGAYAVVGLLRIPVREALYLQPVAEILNRLPITLVMGVPHLWVLLNVIHALLREGVRWLILFFPARSVRTWREGVLFGLGYSWLAALQSLGRYIAKRSEEIELYRYTFVETVEIMNSQLQPELATVVTLDWGVAQTFFNVGTCLVVMLSVRQRNVWLLLAAIMWYVVYARLGSMVLFNLPEMEPYMRMPAALTAPTLTRILVALLPFILLLVLRRTKDSWK
ncbi:MAG: hypothetical protein OXO50_01490 [Caldilineaceae bacterium]|nr:hypothetical protein [Caldilineaceae bacterium]